MNSLTFSIASTALFCFGTWANTLPCRVSSDLLSSPVVGFQAKEIGIVGALHKNAGCIINRKGKTGENEFLMVASIEEGKKLWSMPGGKSASLKNEIKSAKQKKTFTPSYEEPAACTASREAFEETGNEVIVEKLIENTKYFAVFQCSFYNPEKVTLSKTFDPDNDIVDLDWHSLSELKGKKVPLRFPSDIVQFSKIK